MIAESYYAAYQVSLGGLLYQPVYKLFVPEVNTIEYPDCKQGSSVWSILFQF
jgi:hypothetical protein